MAIKAVENKVKKTSIGTISATTVLLLASYASANQTDTTAEMLDKTSIMKGLCQKQRAQEDTGPLASDTSPETLNTICIGEDMVFERARGKLKACATLDTIEDKDLCRGLTAYSITQQVAELFDCMRDEECSIEVTSSYTNVTLSSSPNIQQP